MSATEYLVLPPGASAPTVREAVASLGLHLVDTLKGDGQRLSSEEVWASPDHRLAANIVDDPLVGCQYIALRGADRQALGQGLTQRLGLITPAQALAAVVSAGSAAAQIRAVYHLVVVFPDFDPEALAQLVRIAEHHEDARVREATVDAMAYRAWPQCAEPLHRIAQSDPSADVRRRAAEVLAYLETRTSTS